MMNDVEAIDWFDLSLTHSFVTAVRRGEINSFDQLWSISKIDDEENFKLTREWVLSLAHLIRVKVDFPETHVSFYITADGIERLKKNLPHDILMILL